jgi:phosphatidylglycerol lysyltransferase
VAHYFRKRAKRLPLILLGAISLGMILDPILVTDCVLKGKVCHEHLSLAFVLHAAETTLTALSLISLAVYDAVVRKKLVSISFVAFQIAYGVLFASQLANEQHFNTASQFIYQTTTIVWLAWWCRDYLAPDTMSKSLPTSATIIRRSIAVWAFLNGLLSIVISLAHIHLLGKIQGLYLSSDSAWLAQHGVIVGVVMLYLSRHLMRGELRARQLMLVVVGLQVLKYAVIAPNLPLTLVYAATFNLLFVTRDDFNRGTVAMTWSLRAKDLAYMLAGLLAASGLALLLLDRDDRASRIAGRTFDHLSDYVWRGGIHKTHLESVLLAHTITAFASGSLIAILWILFRPSKVRRQVPDLAHVKSRLEEYSKSSEDYFKLWPTDKQYFWSNDRQGFIAYKIVGAVVFVLADPIASYGNQADLFSQFLAWARARRLRTCVLPVSHDSLNLYEPLEKLQIGASALVSTDKFTHETNRGKWWRWKKNRATKQGYIYGLAQPPYSQEFIKEMEQVSGGWLKHGGRSERGFALGYFDGGYLQKCSIHYLRDQSGHLVAFVNQLPNLSPQQTATIDLLRYTKDASDAMPYLLSKVIESLAPHYKYFDLGFVPFAATSGPIQLIARTLSASRFSAKGLEQFKNKFDPDWQPQYLVYDGDVADMALIALNLERAMETA